MSLGSIGLKKRTLPLEITYVYEELCTDKPSAILFYETEFHDCYLRQAGQPLADVLKMVNMTLAEVIFVANLELSPVMDPTNPCFLKREIIKGQTMILNGTANSTRAAPEPVREQVSPQFQRQTSPPSQPQSRAPSQPQSRASSQPQSRQSSQPPSRPTSQPQSHQTSPAPFSVPPPDLTQPPPLLSNKNQFGSVSHSFSEESIPQFDGSNKENGQNYVSNPSRHDSENSNSNHFKRPLITFPDSPIEDYGLTEKAKVIVHSKLDEEIAIIQMHANESMMRDADKTAMAKNMKKEPKIAEWITVGKAHSIRSQNGDMPETFEVSPPAEPSSPKQSPKLSPKETPKAPLPNQKPKPAFCPFPISEPFKPNLQELFYVLKHRAIKNSVMVDKYRQNVLFPYFYSHPNNYFVRPTEQSAVNFIDERDEYHALVIHCLQFLGKNYPKGCTAKELAHFEGQLHKAKSNYKIGVDTGVSSMAECVRRSLINKTGTPQIPIFTVPEWIMNVTLWKLPPGLPSNLFRILKSYGEQNVSELLTREEAYLNENGDFHNIQVDIADMIRLANNFPAVFKIRTQDKQIYSAEVITNLQLIHVDQHWRILLDAPDYTQELFFCDCHECSNNYLPVIYDYL